MEVRQRRAQAIIMALMIVSLAAEALFQIRTQNTDHNVRYHHESPPEPCGASDPQSTFHGRSFIQNDSCVSDVSYNGQGICCVQFGTLIGQIQPPDGWRKGTVPGTALRQVVRQSIGHSP